MSNFSGNPGSAMLGRTMTQGGITLNVMVSPKELRARKHNAERVPSSSYPGGSMDDNLVVRDGELILTWRSRMPALRPGDPERSGFSSLNGLNFGPYESEEELQNELVAYGYSKINANPFSESEPQNGVSVLAFGSVTVPYNGMIQGFPGDTLIWNIPPLHAEGDQNRWQPAQHPGQPRGKLLPYVQPLEWQALDYEVDLQYLRMMQHSDDNGVHDLSISDLTENKNLSPGQTAALSAKNHTLMTVCRGIEALALREIVTINTPERTLKQQAMELFTKEVLLALGSNADFSGTVDATAATGAAEGIVAAFEKAQSIFQRATATNVNVEPQRGTDYMEYNDAFRSLETGPQFSQSHTYFRSGMNYKRPAQQTRLAGDSLFQNRQQDEANAQLWLAQALNCVGDGSRKQPVVIDDVINTVYVRYAAHDTRLAYFPLLCRNPLAIASMQPTDLSEAYCLNAKDHVLRYQQASAEARHAITRRTVGILTSPVRPGVGVTMDMVMGVKNY